MAKNATEAVIGCLVAAGIGLSPVTVPLWGMSVLGYFGFTTTVTLGIVGAGFVAGSTVVGAAAGAAFEEQGNGERVRKDRDGQKRERAGAGQTMLCLQESPTCWRLRW
jgi:hypothetical protein